MTDKSQIRVLAANIKKNPADSFSKFALALEFVKQDDLAKARLFFENIYEQDPGYVGVYYHLGKLYEQLNLLEKAARVYAEGMKIATTQKELRTLKELQEALAVLKMEMD